MSKKDDVDLVVVTLKVRSPLPIRALGKKGFWIEACVLPDGTSIVGADATAARMPKRKARPAVKKVSA